MRKSYILFVILSLGVFAVAIVLAQGSFLVFFDPASMLLTFIPTLFMLLAVYTPSECVDAFRLAWNGSGGDRSAVMNAIAFFETAQKLLLLMGIVGLMLGCMLMLSAGWRIEKFALGLSYALVCMLYAFITIFLVTVPFSNALRKKLNSMPRE